MVPAFDFVVKWLTTIYVQVLFRVTFVLRQVEWYAEGDARTENAPQNGEKTTPGLLNLP